MKISHRLPELKFASLNSSHLDIWPYLIEGAYVSTTVTRWHFSRMPTVYLLLKMCGLHSEQVWRREARLGTGGVQMNKLGHVQVVPCDLTDQCHHRQWSHRTHLWTEWQTNMTENITFPRLHWRVVQIQGFWSYFYAGVNTTWRD